jgi:hypothetical protein
MGFLTPDSEVRDYSVVPEPVERDEKLHYAILEVEGNPAQVYGAIPIRSHAPELGESMFAAMYVAGEPLVLSRNRCLVLEFPSNFSMNPPVDAASSIGHKCETGGGSAGALLFAASDFGIVALHHSFDRVTTQTGVATRFDVILESSQILTELARE